MKKTMSALALLMLFMTVTFNSTLLLAAEAVINKKQTKPVEKAQVVKPKVIIMLGAPGSGKGTQSIKLARELNIPHISTGDILRENVKKGTKLGKEAQGYMDAGKLVPDELVSELLYERLAEPDAASGYILDGYPRTVSQAKDLNEYLKDKVEVLAVFLDVSDEVITNRILKRAQESKDARSDDTKEIIQERLKTYYEKTEPVIDYYEKKGQLITVDAEEAQEKTFDIIIKAYRK